MLSSSGDALPPVTARTTEAALLPTQICTRTMVFRLEADGILHASYLPGLEQTLADAEENFRATAVWGEGPWPTLVDARAMKPQSRQVRQYNSRPEVLRRIRASAVLVASPLSKAIVNLLITLSRPSMPTRMFTDETEARAWLKGFVV
jgi:hypothetical protein